MEEIKPIIWEENNLKLLDQRLLPLEEQYITCRTCQEVGKCIREMVVRGAPAIGITAAFGLVLAAQNFIEEQGSASTWDEFNKELERSGDYLVNTRPTAVNLPWAVQRILHKAEDLSALPLDKLVKKLEEEAENMHREDIQVNKNIGKNGAQLIPSGATVLTHCNAGALATAGYGTAIGVIRSAWKQGKNIQVFVNETRPFLQGARLTAWELNKENIPFFLSVDSAAGYYINRGTIDCVVVGADRIAANADTANKIGTYTLSVLCRENNIPFYVAAPLSTVDFSLASGSEITVEERGAEEVTNFLGKQITPFNTNAKNPAFDVTPHRYITALITDKEVIYFPNEGKLKHLKEGATP